MTTQIMLVLVGFFMLIKGADYLVDGASKIAKKFHIPTIIIGLTIVSIGTSLPELIVSVTSALKGHSDIAIGNVVGSNLTNMFLILGVCAVIKPLVFQKQTKWIENPITLFVTFLLFLMANWVGENVITRVEGIVLLVLCVGFIIYNIVMARKEEAKIVVEIKEDTSSVSILKSIFFMGLGIVGLKVGGDLVVNGSVEIATIMGISQKVISLTIVAISTSLPELITSITAARKGDVDMAIGNILGSQIFNILLIIGTAATLSPITYSTEFNDDMIILILGTILLNSFPFIGKKDTMTRTNGFIFILCYIFYMIRIVI